MTKHFCDRCDRELDLVGYSQARLDSISGRRRWDLCPDCNSALDHAIEKWMKEEDL